MGDLVFRSLKDYDSEVIMKISDSNFSHIGMVCNLKPLLIIHSDPEFKRVKLTSLNDFTKNINSFGVARIKGLNLASATKICEILKSYENKKFKIAPKHKNNLYCTTLLERAILKFINLDLKYTNISILGGEFLFPQAFLNSSKINLIYQFLYKKSSNIN